MTEVNMTDYKRMHGEPMYKVGDPAPLPVLGFPNEYVVEKVNTGNKGWRYTLKSDQTKYPHVSETRDVSQWEINFEHPPAKFKIDDKVKKKGMLSMMGAVYKVTMVDKGGYVWQYNLENIKDPTKKEFGILEADLIPVNKGGRRRKTMKKGRKMRRKTNKKARKIRRKSMKKGGCK